MPHITLKAEEKRVCFFHAKTEQGRLVYFVKRTVKGTNKLTATCISSKLIPFTEHTRGMSKGLWTDENIRKET